MPSELPWRVCVRRAVAEKARQAATRAVIFLTLCLLFSMPLVADLVIRSVSPWWLLTLLPPLFLAPSLWFKSRARLTLRRAGASWGACDDTMRRLRVMVDGMRILGLRSSLKESLRQLGDSERTVALVELALAWSMSLVPRLAEEHGQFSGLAEFLGLPPDLNPYLLEPEEAIRALAFLQSKVARDLRLNRTRSLIGARVLDNVFRAIMEVLNDERTRDRERVLS